MITQIIESVVKNLIRWNSVSYDMIRAAITVAMEISELGFTDEEFGYMVDEVNIRLTEMGY